MRSHTPVTNFILLGHKANPNLHAVIPLYMSVTYVLSVIGNLTIRLHTPIIVATIVTRDRTISNNYCATQLFFFILLGATEFFLLAALSYDRYVTICWSLHYTTVMSQRVCTLLVLCSCLTGFMVIFPLVILGLQLYFCGSVAIDHFFCDISPLLPLSCSDIWFLQLMALRRKVFSTCSCHIVVISIIYGSCIFMYTKPSAKESVELTKVVAVLNTSLAHILKPFTYTLRNQQVKQAFRGTGHRVGFSSRSRATSPYISLMLYLLPNKKELMVIQHSVRPFTPASGNSSSGQLLEKPISFLKSTE
ncbi:olfactory receptor 6C3-like [Tachyglossus aculeatus]|uniref:olfactory receptor 6C3-like n=1 Tax=Tachyglossus aculeatus TaxID=9261 RepID=UPI0018F73D88|nr:olfactory receptor 6C3-like [Tachyglossus aculeatus]